MDQCALQAKLRCLSINTSIGQKRYKGPSRAGDADGRVGPPAGTMSSVTCRGWAYRVTSFLHFYRPEDRGTTELYECPHPLLHPLMQRQPRRGSQLLMNLRILHVLLERLEELGHNYAVNHIDRVYMVLDPDNWQEADDSDDINA